MNNIIHDNNSNEIESQLKDVITALADVAEKEGFDDWWLYGQLFNPEFLLVHILEKYFELKESWVYSADKANFVYGQMKESLSIKSPINLQITYKQYIDAGHTDMNINVTDYDKLCYWCPKTLETTEDAFKIIYQCISKF